MQHEKRARKPADTRPTYDGNVPDPDGTLAAHAMREEMHRHFTQEMAHIGMDMGMSSEEAARFANSVRRKTDELIAERRRGRPARA